MKFIFTLAADFFLLLHNYRSSFLTNTCIKIVIAITFISFSDYSIACTGFAVKNNNHAIACFNFDFQFGNGQICINKRNVERQRFLIYAEKPVQWISKYGSITFNLAGVNFPHDGMNEAGLVVLSMGLDETKFQKPDVRPAIDENGWIQYQLDNASTINEVIENMNKIRISSRSIGDSHFLIADSAGNAIVIEYINGEEIIYKEGNLPFPILANDTYPNMLSYLKQQKEYGGVKEDKFHVSSSCSRFEYVAYSLHEFNLSSESLTNNAFRVLNDIKQKNTQYQVVYDLTYKCINYKSHNSNEIKTVKLAEMDFDCDSPVFSTAIQSSHSGNIKNYFTEYDSYHCKENLIEFNKNSYEYLPDDVLSEIADSPVKLRCLDKKASAGKENNRLISDLIVSLKQPDEKNVIVPYNINKNVMLDFEIILNRISKDDHNFIIEVPYSSDFIPGNNVFITPNPVTIVKGCKTTKVKIILISERIKKGIEGQLIVKLIGGKIKVGDSNQFSMSVRKE
jgi:choloylglycine hydrolase